MSLTLVAKETLAAIERGAYTNAVGETVALRALVDAAVRGSTTYGPDALAALVATAPWPAASGATTQIELTAETTAEAGRRLVEREQVAHVAALNFASARHPGGGFLGGARAQEETWRARRRSTHASSISALTMTRTAHRARCFIPITSFVRPTFPSFATSSGASWTRSSCCRS